MNKFLNMEIRKIRILRTDFTTQLIIFGIKTQIFKNAFRDILVYINSSITISTYGIGIL